MMYYQLWPLTVLVVHSHFMRLMDILTPNNYRFSNMVLMWSPKVCLVLRTFPPYTVHNFVMPISLSSLAFLLEIRSHSGLHHLVCHHAVTRSIPYIKSVWCLGAQCINHFSKKLTCSCQWLLNWSILIGLLISNWLKLPWP